jgi:acyl carrier protein
MRQADARRMLVERVREHVAAALGHSTVDAVDVDRPFTELGFDSLTAVELRNRLDAETGLSLPPTLAFDHPTITALGEHLYRTLAPSQPEVPEARSGLAQKIGSATDEEIFAFIDNEL